MSSRGNSLEIYHTVRVRVAGLHRTRAPVVPDIHSPMARANSGLVVVETACNTRVLNKRNLYVTLKAENAWLLEG